MKALVTLTSAESKRLIGKGVASLDFVKKAMQTGKVIIGGGTTNAYVAEEIAGRTVAKAKYAAGIITGGITDVTPAADRLSPICFVKGQEVTGTPWQELLKDFTADDVFIKGGNAVDIDGVVGVLIAAPNGGTIGTAMGTVLAVGGHLLMPVGLEKLIPSVSMAVESMGFGRFDDSIGMKTGLIPVIGAQIVTEVEALWELFGVEAVHVASGGVGGSEGAVVLAIEGPKENVEAAMIELRGIKGEPAVGTV